MFDYKSYWNQRYIDWGNSWKWSYGKNAIFKADFINNFIKENNIKTVLEVWVWDGNNLSLYEIENYLGLDISQKAIDICKEKFKLDDSKWFRIMDYTKPLKRVDLILCLDVLFHILNKKEWIKTIKYCIDNSKYTIFYSFPKWTAKAPHLNDYNFEEYLEELSKKKNFTYYKSDLIPPASNSRFYIIIKNV